MNNINVFRQAILFVLYAAIQVFFAKNVELFGLAFCFLYINFILTLPLYTDKLVLLISSFALGFIVDNFYDTLGIHSAACVLIAFLRPYVIDLLSSKNELYELSVRGSNLVWFGTYTLILTLIHHSVLFFLEQFNFQLVLYTLTKIIASTLFTVLVVLIIQYLFTSPNEFHVRK